MILLPNKEYSQRFLDELNYIGYGFLESATEFLIEETDDEYISQELKFFFPGYLVEQDASRCYEVLEALYSWLRDNFYHQITRLHEYVLFRAIHNEWMFFNDLPEEESHDLREAFYSLSGEVKLSGSEMEIVRTMKEDEFYTMSVFFDNFNFGELELLAAFYTEDTFTFLRF